MHYDYIKGNLICPHTVQNGEFHTFDPNYGVLFRERQQKKRMFLKAIKGLDIPQNAV